MKKIIIILVLVFWFSVGLTLNIPKNEWYVLDKAEILTEKQEEILESKIYEIRKKTDIEIWILTIESLEWEDIFNYSLNVAETRWIGDKEKDNGILMLFAINDRERRIQVWYGLEWVITDNIAKRLWEKNIVPNFRKWFYFEWINNTLQDILNYIQKDPDTLNYINATTNNINDNIKHNAIEIYIVLIYLAFISLVSIIRKLVLKYDPEKKKSEIKKWWWINLAIIWAIIWIIWYFFIFKWQIILSGIFWYTISLIWLIIWIQMWDWNNILSGFLLRPKWWFKGGFWWWSSFWWFWGWGFWWGGGGWRR